MDRKRRALPELGQTMPTGEVGLRPEVEWLGMETEYPRPLPEARYLVGRVAAPASPHWEDGG